EAGVVGRGLNLTRIGILVCDDHHGNATAQRVVPKCNARGLWSTGCEWRTCDGREASVGIQVKRGDVVGVSVDSVSKVASGLITTSWSEFHCASCNGLPVPPTP